MFEPIAALVIATSKSFLIRLHSSPETAAQAELRFSSAPECEPNFGTGQVPAVTLGYFLRPQIDDNHYFTRTLWQS